MTFLAFQNILRLLHLHAPPTVYSSFFPPASSSVSSSTDTQTQSHPPHRHLSLESHLGRPPSPISFASRPSSTFSPSSPSSSQSLISSVDTSSLASRPLTPPLPIFSETHSVKFPEWRMKIFDRARRAGVGFMNTAISFHVFGDSAHDSSSGQLHPVHEDRRGRDAARSAVPTPTPTDVQSLAESNLPTEPAGDDSDDDLPYQTGVLDGGDSDTSGSMFGDDTGSEIEWEGWTKDVQRQRDQAFAKLKEDREKHAIQWESNWTWDTSPTKQAPSQSGQGESSLSPRADQTTFAVGDRSADAVSHSKSNSRSVTSYSSADSLLKRTIKRNNSKREPGSATVVGKTERAELSGGSDGWEGTRPRSPLSAEYDDDPDDVLGHEPTYTYAAKSSRESAQPSSSRHQRADADSDAPFYSYYSSSQRHPRSLTMTSISSVVSVGGREDAQSKKKKKEAQKSRGSRKSVLTPLAQAASSFGRSSDHATTRSQSFNKGKSRDVHGHFDELESHSSSQGDLSPHRPAKPKLSMYFGEPQSGRDLSASRAEPPLSAVSTSSADLESPRFAYPEDSE